MDPHLKLKQIMKHSKDKIMLTSKQVKRKFKYAMDDLSIQGVEVNFLPAKGLFILISNSRRIYKSLAEMQTYDDSMRAKAQMPGALKAKKGINDLSV